MPCRRFTVASLTPAADAAMALGLAQERLAWRMHHLDGMMKRCPAMAIMCALALSTQSCIKRDPRWQRKPADPRLTLAYVFAGAALVAGLAIANNARGDWKCPSDNCPTPR